MPEMITPLPDLFGDRFCSRCGHPKRNRCFSCGGKVYIEDVVQKKREICQNSVDTRGRCSACSGKGHIEHVCTGY